MQNIFISIGLLLALAGIGWVVLWIMRLFADYKREKNAGKGGSVGRNSHDAMNGNTCAQIQLSLCLHASGFFARNNDQKNWQWRLHAGKTPALMNQAEKIIVTYFHRTEEHAEACLATTPHDA